LFRIEGERRNTQRALIPSTLANSGAVTSDLHYPEEAEMSLSTGYCGLHLIYKAALYILYSKQLRIIL
jgi:hypothetical protein